MILGGCLTLFLVILVPFMLLETALVGAGVWNPVLGLLSNLIASVLFTTLTIFAFRVFVLHQEKSGQE